MTITNNPFVRTKTEARGFALYVGLDEDTAKANGTTLAEIVAALRKTLNDQVPGLALESFAAVALAKEGTEGRNIDIVRKALGEPRTMAQLNDPNANRIGVIIDLNRHKVLVDGTNADLTNKEFELLAFLVDNPGEAISRDEIKDALWPMEEIEGRTIDVHVRRLRAKLGSFDEIVRTIRGQGYRFDDHPDVLVEGD